MGLIVGFALMGIPLVAAAQSPLAIPDGTPSVMATEVAPEELGAVVSAIAFVDVCQSLRHVSEGMVDAKPLEVTFVQVVGEFCRGMVIAVASTIQAGEPYRADGKKVCIDRELSPEKVIDHIRLQIDRDPSQFIGKPVPQVDTPAAIRRSIQSLFPSSCT